VTTSCKKEGVVVNNDMCEKIGTGMLIKWKILHLHVLNVMTSMFE